MSFSDLQPVTLDAARADALAGADLTAAIGAALPQSYMDVIADFAGPIVFDTDVVIAPDTSAPMAVDGNLAVEMLFGTDAGRYGLAHLAKTYQTRLGANWVPVADAGGGDLFLWNSADRTVHFWHHECPAGENAPEAFTLAAPSLDAFVNRLNVQAPTTPTAKATSVSLQF